MKFIDQSGLKIFADQLRLWLQDQIRKNGIRDSIFELVNELPAQGEKGVVYLTTLEKGKPGNQLSEHIWINNRWEKLGELTTDIDIPLENGGAENSAVLKGGNNQVISENSVALGKENLVGLKGFYYKHIRFVSNTIANIYLSKIQVVPTITTGGEIKDKTIIPSDYLSVGDTISIVNDNKYNDIAVINQMSNGMIQIKWLSEAPFESIKTETNISPEDYSIYCLSKPTQGISDLGKYSFANGTNNKAINTYTEVSGKGNVAKGKFAKVWGKDNVGGYNTTTFGSSNVNLADNSLVNGTNNINEGNNSVIHGNKNKNYGKRAFVVGNENVTNNENEAAFGMKNYSTPEHTIFSIGIGDEITANAIEVTKDGEVYLKGIGDYEGHSNMDDFGTIYYPNSIQDVFNTTNEKVNFLISYFNDEIPKLENRIKELEDIISQITEQE